MIQYWGVRLGEGGKYVQDGMKGNFIAIGWHDLEDLSWLNDEDDVSETKTELKKEYKNEYGGSEISISINSGQIFRFVKEFQVNDIVLVPEPSTRTVFIGKIAGEYKYKANWDDGCYYPHRRNIQWVKEVKRDKIPEKLRNSLGSSLTLFNLNNHKDTIEELVTGTIVEKLVSKTITGKPIINIIIDRLNNLNPREFEEFSTHILTVLGFDAATTDYIKDGGIDSIGTLNAEGLAQITLHV